MRKIQNLLYEKKFDSNFASNFEELTNKALFKYYYIYILILFPKQDCLPSKQFDYTSLSLSAFLLTYFKGLRSKFGGSHGFLRQRRGNKYG